jgi:CheY-like chemotaxis protein
MNLIVAEDDPAMQHWLETVLVRMGAAVRTVGSGWELLYMLADHADAVDLVISDLRMPMPSGIDVLAMARAAGIEIPFVLITAFADDVIRDAATRLDASVLDKPFLAAALEYEIRSSILNGRASASSSRV